MLHLLFAGGIQAVLSVPQAANLLLGSPSATCIPVLQGMVKKGENRQCCDEENALSMSEVRLVREQTVATNSCGIASLNAQRVHLRTVTGGHFISYLLHFYHR